MRVRGAPQLLRNPVPVPCFSHFCVPFFLCFITSASFALCSAERVKEAKSRSGLAVSSPPHADHCLSVPSSHIHPVSLSFVFRRRTPQRGYCQSFTSNVCKKYLGDERVYVTSPLLQGNKEESISKCEFQFIQKTVKLAWHLHVPIYLLYKLLISAVYKVLSLKFLVNGFWFTSSRTHYLHRRCTKGFPILCNPQVLICFRFLLQTNPQDGGITQKTRNKDGSCSLPGKGRGPYGREVPVSGAPFCLLSHLATPP